MLDIIHKKHKDRYRIQFCNENFYTANQNVFKIWKKRFEVLTDTEKLQAWVVGLSCLRRPVDWYGGPRSSALRTLEFTHSLSIGQLFADTQVLIPNKLARDLNVFDFLNSHRIKALPESCYRSLCFMVDGKYPLKLSSGVVSPFDLLQIQLAGERIVSIDEDFESWPKRLYSGRDFLGFILHDLIHADHFFHEPKLRDAQLGFYRFVSTILDDTLIARLLDNAEFKDGFEYIISDMNSHPLHLFQTLHSLLFRILKDDVLASAEWSKWILRLQLQALNETEALLKINSDDFSTENALAIESFSQKFSQQIMPTELSKK